MIPIPILFLLALNSAARYLIGILSRKKRGMPMGSNTLAPTIESASLSLGEFALVGFESFSSGFHSSTVPATGAHGQGADLGYVHLSGGCKNVVRSPFEETQRVPQSELIRLPSRSTIVLLEQAGGVE